MQNPRKITEVRIEAVGEGLAVHELQLGQAYVLNATTALVWNHCDGQTTTAQLAGLLQDKFNLATEDAEKLLGMALTELGKAQLLQSYVARPAPLARRGFLRTMAAVGAALLPLVIHMRPAHAILRTSSTTGSPTTTTPAPNHAPVVTVTHASLTVNAGQMASNAGTVGDSDGNTVSLTASVGTVVNHGNGTWSWSFSTTSLTTSQTVTISANDGHGGTAQTSFALSINALPVVTAEHATVAVNASETATNTGTAIDPDGDPVTLTASFGTVVSNGDGSWSWSFTTTNLTTSQPVAITANDGKGGIVQTSFLLSVNALPMVAANNADVSVNEGQTAGNTGTVNDADGDTVTLAASVGTVINNGDGTWSWSLPQAEVSDSQGVIITANDGKGGLSETNFTLMVINAAPAITGVTGPTGPLVLDSAAVVSATFTDPGISETHTCSFNWGDGSSSTGSVSESGGAGTGTGTHTYADPGIYTVQVTVTDEYGASATASFAHVVVDDPDGGFVTGGGWINSPAGAYPAAPSLTGKIHFGFNSKYQSGSSVPTGQTEFQFKAAGLDFHGSDYAWLVVSGGTAQCSGTGTINGAGGYSFFITGSDGRIDGSNMDKLRMKIWSTLSGVIVYDNAMGAPDDTDNASPRPIGSGSVAIHTS
jgi:hypothetical protein